MFGIFRIILIILSLGVVVLSAFALTGSYKNYSYLTPAYLMEIQFTQLNLSAVIDAAAFQKRDLSSENNRLAQRNLPTPIGPRDLISDISGAISQGLDDVGDINTSDLGGYFSSVEGVIDNILGTMNYTDLGLSDVYSISYWGYCQGNVLTNETWNKELHDWAKAFDNKKVNFTSCTKPKAMYTFDPLTLLKNEINNTINTGYTAGQYPKQLSAMEKTELQVLLEFINYDNLQLPGDIKSQLNTLNGVTKASFVVLLITICLAVISVIIQILAFFLSPHSCCLTFLNFLFQCLILILGILAAGLATGGYMTARREINNNIQGYGVKSYLSINFYAYIWSAAVASVLVVLISLLGHVCGFFGTGRRRYRAVPPPPPPPIEKEVSSSGEE